MKRTNALLIFTILMLSLSFQQAIAAPTEKTKDIVEQFELMDKEATKQKIRTLQAELIEIVFTARGWRNLEGAQNSEGMGFDFVMIKETEKAPPLHSPVKASNGAILIIGNNTIEDYSCQLTFSPQNNMQLSSKWIIEMMNYLPDSSETRQALMNATEIHTVVAGKDTVTGKFITIPVNANEPEDD